MNKRNKSRCLLRCIRIPPEMDKAIRNISQSDKVTYSQCMRALINKGIRSRECNTEQNKNNTIDNVWTWANTAGSE